MDIGTYPRATGEPAEIVNYSERTWIESDGIWAWGYLTYDRPLTAKQMEDYELRAASDNLALVSETYSQVGNTMNEAETVSDASQAEAQAAEPPGESLSAETPEHIDITVSPEPPPVSTRVSAPSTLGGVTISAMLENAGTPISLDEVDMVLRDGGNAKASLYRIVAFFMKEKGQAANADFLARELLGGRYGRMKQSGKGFQIGENQLSVWYDKDGITLCRGNAARYERGAVTIAWEHAAARVSELLEAGHFASSEILGGAIDNERRELAEGLLFFYRDDLRDFREMPEEWRVERGGWQDDVANLLGLLSSREEREKIMATVETDIGALYTDANAPTRFWHKPEPLLAAVRDTLLPLRSFPVAELPAPGFTRFITEDEVDHFFAKDGPYHEGKLTTFSFFLHSHTPKEQADFVKSQYGNSGWSNALNADGSWFDGMRGSIKLTRGELTEPYSTVVLKWPKAAARIKKLIDSGRYITQAEIDHIPEYERVRLARQVNGFFHNSFDKTGWPFPEGLHLTYPKDNDHAAIIAFLKDRALVDETLAAMKTKLDGMQPDDRYYTYDKAAYDRLTEYANGTYTLFPGIENSRKPAAREQQSAQLPSPASAASSEQLSLFSVHTEVFAPAANLPSADVQREAIENAAVAEQQAQEPISITQSDIVDALRRWNGNESSKFAVYDAMRQDSRSRAAALMLRKEYGGDQPAFTVAKDGAEPLTLPWPKVQRYLAGMIEDGSFLSPEEQARYEARSSIVDAPRTEDAKPREIPRETRPVGQNVLLPTVFNENGNYNREGKRSRVTIAEPIGQYQIYSRNIQNASPIDYMMTASGSLIHLGNARYQTLTEEDIRLRCEEMVSRLDAALNNPDQWADYNAAAIADRLDEADAHNASVREIRKAQNEAQHATRVAEREAAEKARAESFNRAVDYIANALVNGERANIARDFDKNPLLALFALYEINVPIATKGWINRHVRGIQFKQGDSSLTVWGDIKEITETFARVIRDLRKAIALTPTDRQRVLISGLDVVSVDDETPAPAEQSAISPEMSEAVTSEPQIVSEAETYSQFGNTPEEPISLTEHEIDFLLTAAVESSEDRDRLHRQYTDAPRSREAVRLLRELYGDVSLAMPRIDGQPGYFGILHDDTGVVLSKGSPLNTSLAERPSNAMLTLTWIDLHKRVAALVAADRFLPQSQARPDADVPAPISDTEEAAATDTEAPDTERGRLAAREPETDADTISAESGAETDAILANTHAETDTAIIESIRELAAQEGLSVSDELIEYAIGSFDESGYSVYGVAERLQDIIASEDITEGWSYSETYIQQDNDLTETEDEPLINYDIGDTVYLEDDTAYTIQDADDFGITLRERNTGHPLYINVKEFERLLRLNPANSYLHEQPKPEAEKPSAAKPEVRPVNFIVTDDHLGEGGPKTKYGFNIAAIRTLKQIENEGRLATPEEQEVLSRFVGWGGIPQAFDGDNESWAKEYSELREILTPDEYEMARASTLNGHYTTPVVIRAMFEAMERLGLKTGNILEPSCGVGNFFGLLPRSMNRTKLYGVEMDAVSGRIASLLYPNADIQVAGFEQTEMPDAFFDAVIGNVPFGDYSVADPKYRQNFKIHEYFFAKALDQVRPGGVVALITSKFLMDKQNSAARKYIAQRAELLGAVRLPNDTFLKNAGTETTTDILFLQRRDRPIDIEPDWVHLGYTHDGIVVNSYYAEHPEMMLGRMALDKHMNDKYGRDDVTACLPIPGVDFAQRLRGALGGISGQLTEPEVDGIEAETDNSIPADPSVRNFSYAMLDGELYYRENSRMYPSESYGANYERLAGLIALRDCCQELIALQLNDHRESEIKAKQAEMNVLYDAFSSAYGLVNSTENARAFRGDSSYYLLCSLEIIDDDGNFLRKADMFTKRTIKAQATVTSVDTASEALAVSIGERAGVDLDFMQTLTGFSREKLIADLEGVIFLNVGSAQSQEKTYVAADEYLSGNIRNKLNYARAAAAVNPSLEVNVRALEAVMPKDLEAGEISARLGATWIDKSYIQQFMYELLQPPSYIRRETGVNFFEYTGEWQVAGKGRIPASNVLACVTYGTKRANAYRILEDTLNLRDVRIYDMVEDAEGRERRVLNHKETTLAQQRQEMIRQKFKDWIWQDPERRRKLVALYNEKFNSVRPREYDGSHIAFSGMNTDITLRQHQRDAAARGIYGGNSLLAHDVGAGKTFEMVAIAMESKRLGLCQKSLFAVPNHLTEQWASDFLRLYPSANILVATKKDFEMKNRRKFCARIATGDYDAVIMGQSQLEKIPISDLRQERAIREQLDEITVGIEKLKIENGERYSIKQLEKTRRRLEARLSRLVNAKQRDDVVTFEQLGVDRLFIDEAHNYKNLFLYTKMRNVAGLSTADAQKSSDLFQKCRYLDELTGGKGIIFATGTPVSNSMTEIYTMQRYLQYDELQARGLAHFDSWAACFGETRTSIELAPEGSGYRARTRFARFMNLPELMSMFKEIADIKTADMIDIPRPDVTFHTSVAEPTGSQKEMVQGLSERAKRVHGGGVDPTIDNMLKIITDGRKIGLDQRLANPLLLDEAQSKVNICAENMARIWRETHDKRLTQMIFCDYSTPKSNIWVMDKKSVKPYAEQMKAIAGAYLAGKRGAAFNVYDDIKAKLILKGIPPEEIAFIHDAVTDEQKRVLFAKVRKGQVRLLFGSTMKVGVGTNVQDWLIALHDLDCPWRPADLQQRAGRIVRFGNNNPEVDVYRYVTNGTFDSYLWQTLENKQRFISQIMTGKSPVRTCENMDEVMFSYAEIKAMCAGDPRIKEKMDLDLEVARLRLIKSEHMNTHFRLQDDLIQHFPEAIQAARERIAGYEKDIKHLKTFEAQAPSVEAAQSADTPASSAAATTKKPDAPLFHPMTILGKTYSDKEKAGAALLAALGEAKGKEQVPIGSYKGFNMLLEFNGFDNKHILTLKGSMSYRTDLGSNAGGNLTRINNALAEAPERLKATKAQLDNLHQQVDSAREELKRPFENEAELVEKEARLAVLNVELNIDRRVGQVIDGDVSERGAEHDDDAMSAKSVRPSIMEGLRTGLYGGMQIRPNAPDRTKTGDLSI